MIPVYIAAILVLVALSAFFSSSEMSFSSANRMRLESMADDGSRSAKTALRIIENFDNTLSAILIGNNLVNIGMSSLASVLMILIVGNDSMTWLATIVITIFVIIFGETMPKIIAKKNANRLALRFALPIRLLTIVLRPVIWVVVSLVKLITLPIKNVEEKTNEEAVEELQSIIETAEDEDVLDEERSELLQAALDFNDVSASEAMTARVDMVAIDIEDEWEDILEVIQSSTYSRLPVYTDSLDNIIGFLYLNHFLKAMTEVERPDIRMLLIEPLYVYKTMKMPQVLAELKRAKKHLAVVTDEYGGTLGVISMEDVLEQIVGEIWDETDEIEEEIVEKADGQYELDGTTPIAEFLELVDIQEESFTFESETVGGWCIEMFGRFPRAGDNFKYRQLSVTVLEADNLRVERVFVKSEPQDADK